MLFRVVKLDHENVRRATPSEKMVKQCAVAAIHRATVSCDWINQPGRPEDRGARNDSPEPTEFRTTIRSGPHQLLATKNANG
jgi:hypothetical protein